MLRTVPVPAYRPPSRLRHWLIPAAVLVLAGMLLLLPHPFDATSRNYGYDWPEDFALLRRRVGIEIVLLYGILRPWSYDLSWRRSAFACLLFLPWVLLNGIAWHNSPTLTHHALWLLVVESWLFVAALVSRAARRREDARLDAWNPGS